MIMIVCFVPTVISTRIGNAVADVGETWNVFVAATYRSQDGSGAPDGVVI